MEPTHYYGIESLQSDFLKYKQRSENKSGSSNDNLKAPEGGDLFDLNSEPAKPNESGGGARFDLHIEENMVLGGGMPMAE